MVLLLRQPAIIGVFHAVPAIDIYGKCGARTRDGLQALIDLVNLIVQKNGRGAVTNSGT